MLRGLLFVIFLLCVACVPAREVPPQLTFTPMPTIVLTEQVYDSGVYRLNYPGNWRVTVGWAEEPTAVTFVAPGDSALILVSTEPITDQPRVAAIPDARLATQADVIALDNDVQVYLLLLLDTQFADQHRSVFERLVNSITIP